MYPHTAQTLTTQMCIMNGGGSLRKRRQQITGVNIAEITGVTQIGVDSTILPNSEVMKCAALVMVVNR